MHTTFAKLALIETLKRIIHDIRCVNAVWCPDTGRFHPDIRENRTVTGAGKILTNLYSMGTALVSSWNGSRFVVARDASRAAAVSAIRDIRDGKPAVHEYNVVKQNLSGARYAESFRLSFDRK